MPVYTIYKIQCGDEVYIGSTRDFTQRKSQHKSCCHKESCKEYNLKIYQTIRENGGWDSKIITPIELLECETITEAHIREQHWIREYNATLNMKQAHITTEERYESHRQQNKVWRENHREQYIEYMSQYNAKNAAKKKAAALNQQSNIEMQPVSLPQSIP